MWIIEFIEVVSDEPILHRKDYETAQEVLDFYADRCLVDKVYHIQSVHLVDFENKVLIEHWFIIRDYALVLTQGGEIN